MIREMKIPTKCLQWWRHLSVLGAANFPDKGCPKRHKVWDLGECPNSLTYRLFFNVLLTYLLTHKLPTTVRSDGMESQPLGQFYAITL